MGAHLHKLPFLPAIGHRETPARADHSARALEPCDARPRARTCALPLCSRAARSRAPLPRCIYRPSGDPGLCGQPAAPARGWRRRRGGGGRRTGGDGGSSSRADGCQAGAGGGSRWRRRENGGGTAGAALQAWPCAHSAAGGWVRSGTTARLRACRLRGCCGRGFLSSLG